jgi:hypothetical protein
MPIELNANDDGTLTGSFRSSPGCTVVVHVNGTVTVVVYQSPDNIYTLNFPDLWNTMKWGEAFLERLNE